MQMRSHRPQSSEIISARSLMMANHVNGTKSLFVIASAFFTILSGCGTGRSINDGLVDAGSRNPLDATEVDAKDLAGLEGGMSSLVAPPWPPPRTGITRGAYVFVGDFLKRQGETAPRRSDCFVSLYSFGPSPSFQGVCPLRTYPVVGKRFGTFGQTLVNYAPLWDRLGQQNRYYSGWLTTVVLKADAQNKRGCINAAQWYVNSLVPTGKFPDVCAIAGYYMGERVFSKAL